MSNKKTKLNLKLKLELLHETEHTVAKACQQSCQDRSYKTNNLITFFLVLLAFKMFHADSLIYTDLTIYYDVQLLVGDRQVDSSVVQRHNTSEDQHLNHS